MPEYDDVFGTHGAGNASLLSDHHAVTVNVALNFAVDPQFTLRNNIAIYDEVRSDNGNVAIATLIADRMRRHDWRRERALWRRLGLFEIWQHQLFYATGERKTQTAKSNL